MTITLALEKPQGWPGSTDESSLPSEFDTRVLDRTAQLQKLNEELEAFSWSVSHDIRAPLSQICAYVMCLKGHPGAKLDDEAKKYLDGIQTCVDRMSRVTQDLLGRERIDRSELVRHRVDLSQMARDIAAALSARGPARRVEWLIAGDLEAEGDRGLIEILLTNLLSNGWKYTAHSSMARIEFGAAA